MTDIFDMLVGMKETYDKNLSLTLAAPELLKAARLALGTLEMIRPSLLGRDPEIKYVHEAIEELRKAILRSGTKDIIQENLNHDGSA